MQVLREPQHFAFRKQGKQRLERNGHAHIIRDAGAAGGVGEKTLFQFGLAEILLVCLGGAALAQPEKEALGEGGLGFSGEVWGVLRG